MDALTLNTLPWILLSFTMVSSTVVFHAWAEFISCLIKWLRGWPNMVLLPGAQPFTLCALEPVIVSFRHPCLGFAYLWFQTLLRVYLRLQNFLETSVFLCFHVRVQGGLPVVWPDRRGEDHLQPMWWRHAGPWPEPYQCRGAQSSGKPQIRR